MLADQIRQLVSEGRMSVFLIGHEMDLVMNLCDPVIVMDRGKKLCEGTPEDVSRDPRVLECYLGGEAG